MDYEGGNIKKKKSKLSSPKHEPKAPQAQQIRTTYSSRTRCQTSCKPPDHQAAEKIRSESSSNRVEEREGKDRTLYVNPRRRSRKRGTRAIFRWLKGAKRRKDGKRWWEMEEGRDPNPIYSSPTGSLFYCFYLVWRSKTKESRKEG